MLQLMLSGVVVSLIVEILKKKNKFDKASTLATLLILSIGVGLIAKGLLDFYLWSSIGWTLIYAGAFYAYVLRNITSSTKVVQTIVKKKK